MAKKKSDKGPIIRDALVRELWFYPVSEEELGALERGSPGSVYLNIALALLPVSVAFRLTLLSTDIKNTAIVPPLRHAG